MLNLSQTIRIKRESLGWSQEKLAIISGLTRDYIKSIESGANKHPRTDKLIRIAMALGMHEAELFTAAGYIHAESRVRNRIETPEEVIEKLKFIQPVSVPVYTTFPFHAGEPTEPLEYVYRGKNAKPAGKNIEGYVVHGECLEPLINDGDIIIVDRDAKKELGDIMACQAYDKLVLGKLTDVDGELWLVNSETKVKYDICQAGAVVIEVIKRLK